MDTSSRPLSRGRTAVLVRRTITFVVFVIAGLAFAFSFGNGLALGIALGVPHWIAALVTPAVDLSVAALIISIQYIRAEGIVSRLYGPRALLGLCGMTTLAINTARALLAQQYGRAAFDAVAPLLLIFWGEVGPGLLALLHRSTLVDHSHSNEALASVRSVPDEERTVQAGTGPSVELIARAREFDIARRAVVGRPISRDRLRAELGVSNALAGELVRIVRATAQDGESG
jgi:hypothetical protein